MHSYAVGVRYHCVNEATVMVTAPNKRLARLYAIQNIENGSVADANEDGIIMTEMVSIGRKSVHSIHDDGEVDDD